MVRLFEVGGHVRDGLLGIPSKDIDVAVEASSWEEMLEHVEANTKKIIRNQKTGKIIGAEFMTIRAVGFDGLGKDFVLCRKDGTYSDGRHPDFVEIGTIFDDLARRDFTVNAIARELPSGAILDPFDGIKDLEERTLRCVGSAEERFAEDTLRILRAIRFQITKDFFPSRDIKDILRSTDRRWADKLAAVKRDRVREEVKKCFAHDPVRAIWEFNTLSPGMIKAIFQGDLWLKATTEKK